MTSALAMFGNDSFVNMAASSSTNPHPLLSICQANNIPFIRASIVGLYRVCDNFVSRNISTDDEIWELEHNLLYNLMTNFSGRDESKEILEIAMFLSSESLLLYAVAARN